MKKLKCDEKDCVGIEYCGGCLQDGSKCKHAYVVTLEKEN